MYIGQWCLPFKVGALGPHTVLPITISCPVVFSWISLMVWNLFPFKGDFSFGKHQKSQIAKSGLYGGWVTWVIWCFAKHPSMRHYAWAGMLVWWSCQSPVVHSCGLLNPLNSFHGGMSKLNIKFDADSLLYLLSPFECDGHTVHMLTQCHLPPPMSSTVKSSLFTMRIPVHSPWLPGYNDVAQTILIILTKAVLFPDRPCRVQWGGLWVHAGRVGLWVFWWNRDY